MPTGAQIWAERLLLSGCPGRCRLLHLGSHHRHSPPPWITPQSTSSSLYPAPSTHRSTSSIGDGTGLQIRTVEKPPAVAGVVASSPDAGGVVDLSEGHGGGHPGLTGAPPPPSGRLHRLT
ncbi:hypothetical protein E2562_006658 [Oryza meyeriana var. granulata]|uniref:Uncharacterized protein n=1 Tax=Oryza meyeriana var. granulata TaxID=110450 RepID=A0A6G1EGZ3_9ORYZ|nr:hypothetical protein E2562_006658 [Oryza meyeriana var. granulata]